MRKIRNCRHVFRFICCCVSGLIVQACKLDVQVHENDLGYPFFLKKKNEYQNQNLSNYTQVRARKKKSEEKKKIDKEIKIQKKYNL